MTLSHFFIGALAADMAIIRRLMVLSTIAVNVSIAIAPTTATTVIGVAVVLSLVGGWAGAEGLLDEIVIEATCSSSALLTGDLWRSHLVMVTETFSRHHVATSARHVL